MRLLRRLTEPLVAMLLVAALVAGGTGDWQSAAVIGVIVVASILLDLVQESQAQNAIDALRHSVAVRVCVRRDGVRVEIPTRDVVAGDILELQAGDLVPSDGVVLETRDTLADEAVLTGEPYPVEKQAGASGEAMALFSGTSLVSGGALMMVVATGARTRLGAIARSMQAQEPPTAFERGVHDLGLLILRLTGFLVLFVLLTQMLRHGLTFESFLFAVALAVGLTPELLPMITTVTLDGWPSARSW